MGALHEANKCILKYATKLFLNNLNSKSFYHWSSNIYFTKWFPSIGILLKMFSSLASHFIHLSDFIFSDFLFLYASMSFVRFWRKWVTQI